MLNDKEQNTDVKEEPGELSPGSSDTVPHIMVSMEMFFLFDSRSMLW